ncbi:Uncharacterized protein Adt_07617 [Abeliophyllum distichum]|uniref:Ubiquitin-like protease family profile domain-containing protein n=1 Tax=Abeliophyllum distichum TaxID=126358 RepID=A0ABD1VAA4_9LAMI
MSTCLLTSCKVRWKNKTVQNCQAIMIPDITIPQCDNTNAEGDIPSFDLGIETQTNSLCLLLDDGFVLTEDDINMIDNTIELKLIEMSSNAEVIQDDCQASNPTENKQRNSNQIQRSSDVVVSEKDNQSPGNQLDDGMQFSEEDFRSIDESVNKNASSDMKGKSKHIDAMFYYLRMRMKFNGMNETRATCTDCLFNVKIRSTFHKFINDRKVIEKQNSLLSYVIGNKIWFGNNWRDINHVFIPVFMDKRAHWILAHFDIANWHLDVYNSSFKTIRDVTVNHAVEPLRHTIPYLICQTKVLNYVTHKSPLSCRLCKDIPQQTNGGDSRIFVIKYAEYIFQKNINAEYIFQKKINAMQNKFDTRMVRYNMAIQLYKYAIEKPDVPLSRLMK